MSWLSCAFSFAAAIVLAGGTFAAAQTPQPFPRPGATAASRPAAPPAAPSAITSPVPAAQDSGAPAALGVAIYPAAQFLASYDAGRGQRYYLFGANASFADVVLFYRTQLDERGDLVYKDPPTHMFTSDDVLGRFRAETMAFPPSVTVKDWMSGGSQGYPNPRFGAEPARFPTVIMIVPAPPAAAPARR